MHEILKVLIPSLLPFIGGIVTLFINQNRATDKIITRLDNMENRIGSLEKGLKEVHTTVDTLKDMLDEQKEYTVTLYAHRLENEADSYFDNGKVNEKQIKNWIKIYERYKKMGGNGYIDIIHSKLNDLFTKEKK